MAIEFKPKIVSVFNEAYSLQQFFRDLVAGLVVGIVAIPLAIAFAIASGVKPEQGLYTAVIAGFVIALFGGSRVQVSGPTGAFIVVIHGIVSQFGYQGLAVATFMAGGILIVMGLLGFGVLLKFVPYPLTVGFTSGIALIIFSSQVKDFLGLPIETLPPEFIPKWQAIFENLSSLDPASAAVGAASLLIVVVAPRINRHLPGSLLALIVSTLAVSLLNLKVETIGSRFGGVPSTIPAPEFLTFDLETLRTLWPAAVTIALLGGIESLLSAVVADGMLGTKHRSNTELIAQGFGNVISPLFMGIPATGAIARTATNIKNGGRTPVAALFHAVVILLVMLSFGHLAALIPIPALAAILIFVAYNMSEWHAFMRALKYPASDIIVLLSTFLLTVLVDLTLAIKVGVILSAFLFIRRMEETAGVSAITETFKQAVNIPEQESRDFSRADIPPGVEVFEAFGPIFFSAADRFTNSLSRIDKRPRVLILYMPKVGVIDGSGLRAIQSLKEKLERESCKLFIAGASLPAQRAIERAEIIEPRYIFQSLKEALLFSSETA